MKMVYRIIQVTTMFLTAYLVISIEKNIPAINQNIADSQKAVATLQQQLDKQLETLVLLQAEISGFRKEVNDRVAKEEKNKESIQSIRAILSRIEEAEVKHKQGDLNKAAEILLSTKESIWHASDIFKSEQSNFRNLMEPIDMTATKWKSGNGAIDTSKISASIKVILEKITRYR
jgi:chromosome segregation ATPase